jgi:hypothetical protein
VQTLRFLRIRFGLVYLGFVLVGVLYELIIHSFAEFAIVNYTLEGFLLATGTFLVLYIAAQIAMFVGKKRSRMKPTKRETTS